VDIMPHLLDFPLLIICFASRVNWWVPWANIVELCTNYYTRARMGAPQSTIF
jgi:hypothetical protein